MKLISLEKESVSIVHHSYQIEDFICRLGGGIAASREIYTDIEKKLNGGNHVVTGLTGHSYLTDAFDLAPVELEVGFRGGCKTS